MISIEQFKQELLDADDYVCVNPDIGRRLPEYRDHALTDAQQQSFEHHLLFCQKCQDDLAYFQWLVDALKSRRAETNAARFADAIALEMAWEPVELVAAAGEQVHTFDIEEGRITISCDWERGQYTRSPYLWIRWKVEIDSERELSLQFINPETRKIRYEEPLGKLRKGEISFKAEDLGFDPSHERWAILIG